MLSVTKNDPYLKSDHMNVGTTDLGYMGWLIVFTHISMCMYLQFTNNELCRIPHEVLSKETLMEWDQIMSEYPQQL